MGEREREREREKKKNLTLSTRVKRWKFWENCTYILRKGTEIATIQ
jgi:hypothetical protein